MLMHWTADHDVPDLRKDRSTPQTLCWVDPARQLPSMLQILVRAQIFRNQPSTRDPTMRSSILSRAPTRHHGAASSAY